MTAVVGKILLGTLSEVVAPSLVGAVSSSLSKSTEDRTEEGTWGVITLRAAR